MMSSNLPVESRGTVRTLFRAAVWSVLVLLSACSKPEKIINRADFDPGLEPDLVLYDFDYETTTGTRKNWTLRAQEARKYDVRRTFVFRGVNFVLYENGVPGSRLTAKAGTAQYDSRDMTAISNVRVVFRDGTVLTSEELIWSDERKILHTEKFVRIVKPTGDRIEGYGLEMDRNADTITIRRRVSGSFDQENKL
jgi:LPS export ABC transporter protein LptC